MSDHFNAKVLEYIGGVQLELNEQKKSLAELHRVTSCLQDGLCETLGLLSASTHLLTHLIRLSTITATFSINPVGKHTQTQALATLTEEYDKLVNSLINNEAFSEFLELENPEFFTDLKGLLEIIYEHAAEV